MMKYVVCGTSVEDVEAGVQAMKMAIASGATCGVGGSTMAEVEKNLGAMKQMVGGNAPTAPKACSCSCPRSVSGRELLNMIKSAKGCSAIVSGDIAIYGCEDEDEEIEVEDSGYVARANGDVLTDVCESAEEAMAEALSEGYSLCDIEIWEADLYEDGELVLNEQVFPD